MMKVLQKVLCSQKPSGYFKSFDQAGMCKKKKMLDLNMTYLEYDIVFKDNLLSSHWVRVPYCFSVIHSCKSWGSTAPETPFISKGPLKIGRMIKTGMQFVQ